MTKMIKITANEIRDYMNASTFGTLVFDIDENSIEDLLIREHLQRIRRDAKVLLDLAKQETSKRRKAEELKELAFQTWQESKHR